MSWSDTSSRTIVRKRPRKSATSKLCRRASSNITTLALREMDLDAVLARKPMVALVDELAHTNAPGSKNRKRYEDIQDLLAAGINVISTVNIQHLESLYNIVEQATGVRVKERVPDEVVAQADQIVTVDLPSRRSFGTVAVGKNLSA